VTPANHPLVERARVFVPALREQSAAIERERRVPKALNDELVSAGFLRMSVPRSLGGEELSPRVMVEVLEQLASGDGATAWCVMTSGLTAILSGYMPEAACRAIWEQDPGAVAAGVFAPSGKATPVSGGYRLTGKWAFASGCDNASWLLGGGLVFGQDGMRTLPSGKPELRSFLFPAKDARIHDTWDTAGLCGTGSHTIEVEDLFIPDEHSVCFFIDPPRERGPLYRFPFFGLLASGIAAVAIGTARAAIDELLALAPKKKRMGIGPSLAEQTLAQVAVAEAEGKLGAARAQLLTVFDEVYEECRALVDAGADARPDARARARLRIACCHATRASLDAVTAMYELGGGVSLYRSSPLQRYLRDAHTITQHAMVMPEVLKVAGAVLLGAEVDTSRL